MRYASLEEGLAAIQRGEEAVEIYNSDDKKIEDDKAKKVAAMLKNNRTLKLLDLSGNKIGDAGAGSLAEALKVNSTLTSLNLYDNYIDSEGAGSLAEALKVNTALTYLNLWDNKIGPEGAGSLSGALKVNSTLTALNLKWNEFGPEGAGSLAEALKVNNALTALNLGGNEIGSEGAGSLAEALKVNSTLTKLELISPNLVSEVYLAACASFQIQRGVKYGDARVRAAQAHGIEARKLGISPFQVPQEVLDRDSHTDASNTIAYLEGVLYNPAEAHQLKVLLVGPQRVGKTSLRRALKEKGRRANPTRKNDAERATISVDIDEIEFEALAEDKKGGKISLWDFGGQEEYYMTHTFFLSSRSLVMLVVDLRAYEDTDEEFERCAGKWLRILQMQISRAKVVLVGTKCDQVNKFRIKRMMESLQRRVDELGMKVIEAITKNTKDLSKEELEMQGLTNFEGLTFTEPMSFAVSGVDVDQGDGVAKLYDFLRELASNPDKEVALRVPKAFEDLRSLIDQKRGRKQLHRISKGKTSLGGKLMQRGKKLLRVLRRKKSQIIQSLEELQREAGLEQQGPMFRVAMGLLHDLGIILWYEKSEQLSDVVFSDPAWVIEIVRQVFRHDLFERFEGDKKEGALYDLKGDGTVDLPTLQELLKSKCILDERLLRLFPMWKDMDNEMFDRCVNLLQEFDLMYKITQSDQERHQASQYMVPLFLRTGFIGSTFREVSLGSKKKSRSKRLSRSSSSSSRVCQSLSTQQVYNFFVFLPYDFLFRVIARTFRLAEFTNLSEDKAKAEYKTKGGVCIDVELTSQVKSDGSGVFSIRCNCLSSSEEALEPLKRTQDLFAYEVNQLLEDSFRLVPFKVTVMSSRPEQLGEAKKSNSAPSRTKSTYVCQNADDFSYFCTEKDGIYVEWALSMQNRYMVKRHCLDAIRHQLDKEVEDLDKEVEDRRKAARRKAAHLVHVGKDVRGKLERNFRLSLESLHRNDPLRELFFKFEDENRDESGLDVQKAEEFLKLVRRFLSRLRTEFDCFLAHKWGEGGLNHKAVVQLKEGLEKKGLRCWVDESDMLDTIEEMLEGINKSQVFVACITKDYLKAMKEKDSYCKIEYQHAVAYKPSHDFVPMFMDKGMVHPHFLQYLPKMAWKLHCSSDDYLFDRVLQQLFLWDDASTRPALLEMYPAMTPDR